MHEFSPLLYIGEKCKPEVSTLSENVQAMNLAALIESCKKVR